MSYSYRICPSRVQFNDVHATLIHRKLPAAGGPVPLADAVSDVMRTMTETRAGRIPVVEGEAVVGVVGLGEEAMRLRSGPRRSRKPARRTSAREN